MLESIRPQINDNIASTERSGGLANTIAYPSDSQCGAITRESLMMHQMIRIGFDARWYNNSGIGTYVGNLLECLGAIESNDFEIILYEHADNPVPVDNPKFRKRIVRAARYSPQEQIELAAACRRDRLDVFHAPFYIVPLFASCPVVTTVHDLMAFLFPLYGFVHKSIVCAGYRAGIAKAKKVIAISDTTAKDLGTVLRVPEKKVVRIYNAYSKSMYHSRAEPGERDYLRERFGINGQYVLTLSAGNWRTKNLLGALRAMAIAEQRSPVPFQSVIAGPEDGYRAAGFNGRLKNPIVTGFVSKEDLPKLYRNASGFLSVSLYEGFGAPLVEAMGCGCPCVVSTGGSLPEIAGKAAPTFDCHDATGMADALIQLLRDPLYREQQREVSLARAAQFSYMISARETLQVYRELAGFRS